MKLTIVVSFLETIQLIHCHHKPPPSRVLKVLVRKFEPYAMQDDDGAFRRGYDITLMNAIAQKLNVNVKYEAFEETSIANITHHLSTK